VILDNVCTTNTEGHILLPKKLTPLEPTRFGLVRFADLLPAREHIVGEDAGSFEGFREEMTRALAPLTPYESVIAENLISIEWELIQHRRMRDTGLRNIIRDAILKAVGTRERAAHEAALDEKWNMHLAAGGTEDDWNTATSYDRDAAKEVGGALAARAVSRDFAERAAANDEIEAMGLATRLGPPLVQCRLGNSLLLRQLPNGHVVRRKHPLQHC
jgi:hypothetical protein